MDTNSLHLIKSSKLYAENTKNELEAALEWIIKESHAALWEIQHGQGNINPLGILQRTGQDVDRLAALYMERKNKAIEIEHMLKDD